MRELIGNRIHARKSSDRRVVVSRPIGIQAQLLIKLHPIISVPILLPHPGIRTIRPIVRHPEGVVVVLLKYLVRRGIDAAVAVEVGKDEPNVPQVVGEVILVAEGVQGVAVGGHDATVGVGEGFEVSGKLLRSIGYRTYTIAIHCTDDGAK